MIRLIEDEIDRIGNKYHEEIRIAKQQQIFIVRPEDNSCRKCGNPMKVQKTRVKHTVTIRYGVLPVRITTLVCKSGCKTSSGKALTRSPDEFMCLIPPKSNFGYDVEVMVGKARYLDHLQRDEIRKKLWEEHSVPISNGKISDLARRFVDHLSELQWSRRKQIRAELLRDGGYPLHIDATGEDGSGTILIVYAGWRGWILGSWKLTTECAEQIKPRLHEVADQYGDPCAIVRDLGRAMIPACQEFVKERRKKIPILSCHTHFLKDIGKDLLTPGYDELRRLIRKHKLKASLRMLARVWGRKFGKELSNHRINIEKWTSDQESNQVLPRGHSGVATVRALAQWALDYQEESNHKRFPFELPYLAFYQRCKIVRRACNVYLKHSQHDKAVRKALQRLVRVTDPVITDPVFPQIEEILSYRYELFNELRDALRLNMEGTKPLPTGTQHSQQIAKELNDIEKALRNFTASLRRRYPKRGPAENKREAIDIILTHIKKHRKTLWGHVIKMHGKAGGGIKIVDRTNNGLENFNGTYKQGERRRSGRKVLSKDFEDLPGAAPMVQNLRHVDFVKLLCGTIDKLPEAFAMLDQKKKTQRTCSRPPKDATDLPQTASLSKVDRQFIRRIKIGPIIQAAALKRAPNVHV